MLDAKATGFRDKSLYDWLDLLIVPVVLATEAWLLKKARETKIDFHSYLL